MTDTPLRIGIDIGGTFTDFAVYNPQTKELLTHKILSTPDDPSDAVISGLSEILEDKSISIHTKGMIITHGSTVTTNALLEHKGAKAALITTAGFRDVLEIGRQNRPSLYDLHVAPSPPLIPASHRLEIDERVNRDGKILLPISLPDLDDLLKRIKHLDVESVAVCLLFSFMQPKHEKLIGKLLKREGFFYSLSSEIIPEFREYERTSTTVVNAYVSPKMGKYLCSLEQQLKQHFSKGYQPLRVNVMQSNGGTIQPSEARREAVRCILSGPAGGIVGCEYIGRASFLAEETQKGRTKIFPLRLITFDMGGTSTDVSLIDDTPQLTTESVVGGYPLRIPMLNIHTIGAGGGSIAFRDPGGALCVGPESAGARPGPACYGKGTHPTVTDAHVVLGRLCSDYFLGGRMPLDLKRAKNSFEHLGSALELSPTEVALGVISVVNAHMERALRLISVERGYDARDFSLLAFGGAGGLHAAALARCLGMSSVIIPPLASTLSAFGMLAADIIKDSVLTVMLPGDASQKRIDKKLYMLSKKNYERVLAEGVDPKNISVNYFLDMRYAGQSYELIVPYSPSFIEDFHKLHEKLYGYSNRESAIQIVNLRAKVIGRISHPPLKEKNHGSTNNHKAFIGERKVIFESGEILIPFFKGENLQPKNHITGPAIIARSDTTVFIGPADKAFVDTLCNIHIQVED